MMKTVTTMQKLANATKTYYSCGGHNKAERNDEARKQLANQLSKEGKEIPSDHELCKIGEFNGEGAV